METWDEVGTADYIFRVKEPKGAILEAGYKLDAIQPFCLPAGSVGFVNFEPANPENVHPGFVNHRWSIENVESVDSEDLCIDIWVNAIL